MMQTSLKTSYLDYTKVEKSKKTAMRTDWQSNRIKNLSSRKDRMLQYSTYPLRGDFPVFKIAGRHKVSRVSCGIYTIDQVLKDGESYACKEHPELSIVHKKISCNKLGCPVCVGSAVSVRAKTIGYRMVAIAKEVALEYRDIGKAKHLSINIKVPKIIDIDRFKWLQKGIINLLQKVGIHSGVIFHHPVRIDEGAQELYESHHFHVIGYGNIIKSDLYFKRYRHTYRNHGERQDTEHMLGTIQYIMSHCGLHYKTVRQKNRVCWGSDYPRCRKKCEKKLNCRNYSGVLRHDPSYKYFGIMAPSNVSASIIEQLDVKAECPVCQEPLYEIVDGLDMKFLLNPLAEKRIKKYENSKYLLNPRERFEVHELKGKLIIDVTEPYWKNKSDLKYSDEVLWEKKPIYQVTIRRDLTLIINNLSSDSFFLRCQKNKK